MFFCTTAVTESCPSFIYLFHKQDKGSSSAHFSQNYIGELTSALVKALNPVSLGAYMSTEEAFQLIKFYSLLCSSVWLVCVFITGHT